MCVVLSVGIFSVVSLAECTHMTTWYREYNDTIDKRSCLGFRTVSLTKVGILTFCIIQILRFQALSGSACPDGFIGDSGNFCKMIAGYMAMRSANR